MSLSSTFQAFGLALGLFTLNVGAITVTVPASANPWLAGAADGTTGQLGQDVAPAQSPVEVNVQAGDTLTFFASGSVYDPSIGITPEGDGSTPRSQMALNGIGGITGAPQSSLIGVFLDASVPTPGGEPSGLDFSGTNRNYATLAPALRQPFFIGNGMDKVGLRQQFTVPAGATRLLLGTMYEHSWYARTGSITVTVDTAPTASNGTTWGTPFEITGPSDVSTDGALIGAYNISDYTGSAIPGVTLNGVLFTGLVTQYLGASVGPFTLYGDTTRGYNSFGDSVAPYTDLDADYRDILKSGLYDNSVSADGYTLTIDALEIGQEYSIQFWVNESNGSVNGLASPENATVITDVNGVTIDRNTLNQVGGVGQSVIGAFTANATNKTFQITSSHGGRVVLNAFQLRKINNAPQFVSTELPVLGESFTVTGGTGPYAFEIVSGSLPPGLSLTSEGMITGTLTGSSVGGVAIRVTDSLGAIGGQVFQYSFDLGLPEIELKRVVIQDVGGTNRMAIFELTASDDVALAPYETDPLFTNASHAFEYRRKDGTGAFSAWETAMYFPFNYPPAIPFDTANDFRVEFRGIDAAGTRSRTLAYDIKKGALPTTDQSFGASVAPSTTLITDAGTSIIKLFAEDLNGNPANSEVAAVDRDTGKISVIYNNKRTAPASSAKATFTLGSIIKDAAVGMLMPTGTGVNDRTQDFVVCTSDSLRIITNKPGASPSLALHGITLPIDGTPEKVAVGDVNADGADDIIAIVHKTTAPDAGYYIVTFLNQATATSASGAFNASGFAAPIATRVLLVDTPRSLATGDIDGDGAADVAFGYRTISIFTEGVNIFMGTPGGELSPPSAPILVTDSNLDEEIVDIKIADYSGHVTGQKDVIVGIIGGPDATYPTATHMAKHRVLVHQSHGGFTMAPTRRLAALSLSTAETDVFNIAVGNLSDRVVPDIVSCQFDSSSPAGTIDTGFLPPANATGELNWMLSNENGVQTFGTSSGRPRRVAVADLTGNALPDV
ncbi:MAG: hypothetical protein KDK97_14080, partial [Verrucomicrobiales bacterium]|nr:hypothetical protein [Verrucomicrobiales bacterium]